jgi:hypothetical protein
MIICIFLRLSIVMILPRTADHGKREPSKEPESATHSSKGSDYLQSKSRELKKDLTLNMPLLEETHQSLFVRPLLTIAECNSWKKEAKTSTSQSSASLTKLTFH